MNTIFLSKPLRQVVTDIPAPGDEICIPEELAHFPDVLFVFVRHVGCPFAERDIKFSNTWAAEHTDVAVVIVTHGDIAVRDAWLEVIGGAENLHFYHDPERMLYGRFGLGYSSAWHFMGPASLWGVVSLWRKGIRNRMASGTRWQRAGVFQVRHGCLIWRAIPQSAEMFELP